MAGLNSQGETDLSVNYSADQKIMQEDGEKLLGKIANFVDIRYLREFAIIKTGIQDAKFYQLTHKENNWDKCYQVWQYFVYKQ